MREQFTVVALPHSGDPDADFHVSLFVAPDIEVDNLPVATAQGGDAQLDAAIANVLQRLRETPLPALKAQPLPARGTPGHAGTA